jgi:hypothetical protein
MGWIPTLEYLLADACGAMSMSCHATQSMSPLPETPMSGKNLSDSRSSQVE